LAEAIVNAGGGLISEQIPGSEPNPQRLVARNRLQVAFSEIVVAAQAGIPSGTLHTVRFALEQNKRLVVPKPTGTWAGEKSSTANMALTDPLGCSPTILNAGSSLAKVLLARRPIADVVLSSDDIDAIWR
jgi:DNA processing protein